MHQHLVRVVVANKIAQRENPMEPAQDSTQINDPGPSEEKRFENFTHQKEAMFRKLEDQKTRRAAVSSKLSWSNLSLLHNNSSARDHPERIFVVGSQKRWYAGTVVAIEKSNFAKPMHTVYSIDYDEEEEEEKYPLLVDLNKNELVVL